MRSGRVRILNGNQRETLYSRADRRRVFKLGGKVGHETRYVRQLLKVKTSRDVSTDKKCYNSAVDGYINFEVGGNYRRGDRRLWYTS